MKTLNRHGEHSPNRNTCERCGTNICGLETLCWNCKQSAEINELAGLCNNMIRRVIEKRNAK